MEMGTPHNRSSSPGRFWAEIQVFQSPTCDMLKSFRFSSLIQGIFYIFLQDDPQIGESLELGLAHL